MNQTDEVVIQALDHFISQIFPILFKGRSTTDPNYKRVYALVSERNKQKSGKTNRLNDDWIIKTLTEFAPDKYSFNRVTTVTINLRDNGKPE